MHTRNTQYVRVVVCIQSNLWRWKCCILASVHVSSSWRYVQQTASLRERKNCARSACHGEPPRCPSNKILQTGMASIPQRHLSLLTFYGREARHPTLQPFLYGSPSRLPCLQPWPETNFVCLPNGSVFYRPPGTNSEASENGASRSCRRY